MNFAYSPKVQELRERVQAFMDAHVYPAEKVFYQQVAEGDRWQPTAIVEELKAKAKAEGLWNLFLPESELGAGLTNTEYAPLAEIMGSSGLGPEAFNCSAPDTGNMEVLVRYGSEAQKREWLEPLMTHSSPARCVRVTSGSSTVASGGPPAPATRAARS